MDKTNYTDEEYSKLVATTLTKIRAKMAHGQPFNLSTAVAEATRAVLPKERWPEQLRPMTVGLSAHVFSFKRFGSKIRKNVLASQMIRLSDRENDYLNCTGDFWRNQDILSCQMDDGRSVNSICEERLKTVFSCCDNEAGKQRVETLLKLNAIMVSDPTLSEKQVVAKLYHMSCFDQLKAVA
jgi:hypothetical protein